MPRHQSPFFWKTLSIGLALMAAGLFYRIGDWADHSRQQDYEQARALGRIDMLLLRNGYLYQFNQEMGRELKKHKTIGPF